MDTSHILLYHIIIIIIIIIFNAFCIALCKLLIRKCRNSRFSSASLSWIYKDKAIRVQVWSGPLRLDEADDRRISR